MAITNLVPVFDRVKRPNFKVISEVVTAEKIHPRKYGIYVISLFLACLVLRSTFSILATSDAFVLETLKHQKNLAQDQRDALVIKVNQMSSPNSLASAALALGMKPAENITYLNLAAK